MIDIRPLFARPVAEENGIFLCLPPETTQDKVKSVDMETYSVRAAEFSEKAMTALSADSNRSLEPLRAHSKSSVFLEVGGGDGRFAFQLMREGFTVIESDIAPGSVQRVKEVAQKNQITGGAYAVIDAEHLPFKDSTLDGVFMVATLHHLPDPRKAMLECLRVLKPGGTLLILREPATWQYVLFFPLFWLMRKLLRKRNKNVHSLADDVTWGFTQRKIRKLLPEFSNIQFEPVDYIRKVYTNLEILRAKFMRKPYRESAGVARVAKKIDRVIAKIPVLKWFPWDWDVIAQKPK